MQTELTVIESSYMFSHTCRHVSMGVCVCVCVWCQYIKSRNTFPPVILSAIMDMKAAFVIACLCALAITCTEGNYQDKFPLKTKETLVGIVLKRG